MTVLTTAAGAVAAPLPASAATGPSAAIGDWRMPDRVIDANQDGYIDGYLNCQQWAPNGTLGSTDNCRTSEIDPGSFLVQVSACASQPGDAAIATYEFRINGVVTYSGTGCEPFMSVPAQGAYEVDVTVRDANGNRSSAARRITVRDLLVVSLGDSYGSGEGVPPFIDQFPEALGKVDSRCDRSTRAATAQAALRLEKEDPRTSVTFVHLACSGAQIVSGVAGPYRGANPTGGDVIPPQVDYLRSLIGDRPIDLMNLSIGGNDLGFADIITACLDPSYATALLTMPVNPVLGAAQMAAWMAYPNCDMSWSDPSEVLTGGRSGGKVFEQGLAALPGRYKMLHDKLQSQLIDDELLTPQQVYLTEYPDFTRDNDGDWCGWTPANPNSTADLPGFTKTEFRWASEVVAPSLTAAMRSAAQSYRWNFIGGISSQYNRHGYCAEPIYIEDAQGNFYPESQHWLVGLGESLSQRSSQTSAFHPNIKGQTATANRIYSSWSADLLNPRVPPTISVFPTALVFAANSGGANGWFTGQCNVFGGQCNRDGTSYTVQIKGGKYSVKGPLVDHVHLSIDGKAVTFTNGSDACSAPDGDTCGVFVDNPAGPNLGGVTIVIGVKRPGEHRLDISADNVLDLTGQHSYDFKVDLTPPAIDPVAVTAGTLGKHGWYTTPVDLRFTAADAAGGSGLMNIETTLLGEGDNGTPKRLETTGDPSTGTVTATLTTDGDHVVSSEALDRAGLRSGDPLTREPDGPRYDHVKIDRTLPTVTVSGVTDGIASWTGAAAGEEVFTNKESVTVTYSAADATSGVYEVRAGTVFATSAAGNLTVPVPKGLSTQLLVVEDYAGHTAAVPFSVYRTDAPAKPEPQGPGFWRTAVSTGKYTAAGYSQLLTNANAVSRSFGVPTGWYADVTPSSVAGVLQPSPAADANLKVRRDLLTTWLNLTSGRLGAGQAVDLKAISGWNRVVANTGGSSRTTALNLVREAERNLTSSVSTATLETIETLLERLNTNKLS